MSGISSSQQSSDMEPKPGTSVFVLVVDLKLRSIAAKLRYRPLIH